MADDAGRMRKGARWWFSFIDGTVSRNLQNEHIFQKVAAAEQWHLLQSDGKIMFFVKKWFFDISLDFCDSY